MKSHLKMIVFYLLLIVIIIATVAMIFRGTEQEKLPILRSYPSISDLGSIIYPILIELDRLFEKVLIYITESRASRE